MPKMRFGGKEKRWRQGADLAKAKADAARREAARRRQEAELAARRAQESAREAEADAEKRKASAQRKARKAEEKAQRAKDRADARRREAKSDGDSPAVERGVFLGRMSEVFENLLKERNLCRRLERPGLATRSPPMV